MSSTQWPVRDRSEPLVVVMVVLHAVILVALSCWLSHSAVMVPFGQS